MSELLLKFEREWFVACFMILIIPVGLFKCMDWFIDPFFNKCTRWMFEGLLRLFEAHRKIIFFCIQPIVIMNRLKEHYPVHFKNKFHFHEKNSSPRCSSIY